MFPVGFVPYRDDVHTAFCGILKSAKLRCSLVPKSIPDTD
jgi:hypothetical protein